MGIDHVILGRSPGAKTVIEEDKVALGDCEVHKTVIRRLRPRVPVSGIPVSLISRASVLQHTFYHIQAHAKQAKVSSLSAYSYKDCR